jgi:hypothetical protein
LGNELLIVQADRLRAGQDDQTRRTFKLRSRSGTTIYTHTPHSGVKPEPHETLGTSTASPEKWQVSRSCPDSRPRAILVSNLFYIHLEQCTAFSLSSTAASTNQSASSLSIPPFLNILYISHVDITLKWPKNGTIHASILCMHESPSCGYVGYILIIDRMLLNPAPSLPCHKSEPGASHPGSLTHVSGSSPSLDICARVRSKR